MNIQYFSRSSAFRANKQVTNKDIAKRSNAIAIISCAVAGIISLAALIVSIISMNMQNKYSALEQSLQPLIYTYTLETDKNVTQTFGNYETPTIYCYVDIHSGFPRRIATINSDTGIENMYGYSSKSGVPPLTNLHFKFSLPFSSLVFCEDTAYQYIFVYYESADGAWNLDCVALSYNQSTGYSSTLIFDELDLLRLEFERNEAIVKILQEYQTVYQSIASISNQ